MTTEASPKPPPDGRCRPTISNNSSTLLSQLSFITESPHENDPELVEHRHALRFETDCTVPVLNILKLFIEQLLLLDSKASLLSKDQKQHFITAANLPTTPIEIQKLFPATILNRRFGNRLVLRMTICSSKTFLELTQLGLVTWANRNRFRLETDIYQEDDVRDCLWIAGRDSQTSKPFLHQYLNNILNTAQFDDEEQTLLNTYRAKHNLKPNAIPTFSIYWRKRVVFNKLTTQALVVRTDATIQRFFVKFFTRANKNGVIPEKKGRFIPMSVSKNNENATKRAMDGQNQYLTATTSIPIIGLSFEALNTVIAVGESGQATVESIIYQNCLSLEPTAKSQELGRFNLICLHTEATALLEFVNTEIPKIWSLLPPEISNKFKENLQILRPRLTAGYSGQTISGTNSVVLDDPQSVSSTVSNQWTQPPNINRPPRYVSVIYKDDEASQTTSHKTNQDNQTKPSSEKSQHTIQSDSDLSTLVSSIREEMNREFQAHTELINALKDEIVHLRTSTSSSTPTPQPTIASLPAADHANVVESLRHEIQELRQALPHGPPPLHDMTKLITSIVENMVPLITAAVRQGLDQDPSESVKRSRIGSTPTQFRGADIQPINLMHSYPESPKPPSIRGPDVPSPSALAPNSSNPSMHTAPRSEAMEE